jgi:methylmalonyl-CoA mutase N-terminal domain/subunit
MMKERFGARNPESMRLRFHTQTAAATLTKPQPANNIVRTALQALSAVLGGTQSLHTNGLDEAYAIPSEHAMKVALRTQQIIADETGVSDVIDPLGGSWYVEALTDQFEQAIEEYLAKVDELGGTIAAIEANYFQREIADTAYDFALRKSSGERVVVGVNKYVDKGDEPPIEIHKIDPETERRKIEALRRIKSERDGDRVREALDRLRETAREESGNLMPPTIEAVRARASMGEIVKALEDVFGRYTETPVF